MVLDILKFLFCFLFCTLHSPRKDKLHAHLNSQWNASSAFKILKLIRYNLRRLREKQTNNMPPKVIAQNLSLELSKTTSSWICIFRNPEREDPVRSSSKHDTTRCPFQARCNTYVAVPTRHLSQAYSNYS